MLDQSRPLDMCHLLDGPGALEPWSPALYGDRAMAMVRSWISSGVGKASVWTLSHWRSLEDGGTGVSG